MDRPVRVLLVDDDPADRLLAARHLAKELPDLKVEEAADPAGLGAALERGGFDLVVTDYRLAWSDGLAVLAQVKERYPDCPVIMFTGTGNEEVAVAAMKSGLDDYVIKGPRHAARLRGAARAVLERAEAKRRARAAEEALRQSEAQLRQAQKMEALGRLAGGVAHDFNNHLTVILGHAERLLVRLRPGDPARHSAEQIHQAGLRAARLTAQLLALSRKQIPVPQVLDLNAVVAGMERMLKSLVGDDIVLEVELASGLWPVLADCGHIEQVLLNLAVNARDAMPRGGRMTLSTANVPGGKAAAGESVAPRDTVRLAVADTGTGMDRATLAQAFEPFFTTKPAGAGTGLGLARVQSIVEQSGGRIAVSSEPGAGTRFEIFLPRAQGAAVARPAAREAPRPPRRGGSETVLIVEDEAALRELLGECLRAEGYRVLEAGGAGEALDLCRGHEGPIELVVTDVVMPRAGGDELARDLASLRPEARVLFVSGYPGEARVVDLLPEGRAGFLSKPFTPEALLEKVSALLGAAGGG